MAVKSLIVKRLVSCAAGLILVASLTLAACSTTPKVDPVQYVDRVVKVDVPVPVHPIKPEDVPVLPAPLGRAPPTLQQRADVLLGKVCEFVAYALTADPMLHTSAGIRPVDEPVYPECKKH